MGLFIIIIIIIIIIIFTNFVSIPTAVKLRLHTLGVEKNFTMIENGEKVRLGNGWICLHYVKTLLERSVEESNKNRNKSVKADVHVANPIK